MLCSRKLKVVHTTLILFAGLVGVTAAHAQDAPTITPNSGLNLSTTPDPMDHDVVVYARETIGEKAYTTPKATPGSLFVTADLDTALPANSYIRLDLMAPAGGAIAFTEGLMISLDVSGHTDDGSVGSEPLALQLGGGDGHTMGIWSLGDMPVGIGTQGSEMGVVRFDLGNNAATAAGDSGRVFGNAKVKLMSGAEGGEYMLRLRSYSSIANARAGGPFPFSDFSKPIIAADNTLSVKITAAPMMATATVESGFTMFDTGASATLATAAIAVATTHNVKYKTAAGADMEKTWAVRAADDGMPVAMGDVFGSGTVTVDGDFSAGAWTLGGGKATYLDGGGDAIKADDDGEVDQSGAVGASFALAAGGFMVKGNETPISPGTYSGKIEVSLANTDAAAVADQTGVAMGEIKRDGTTVHIGYLTTFEGHNQRLIIANRSKRDADYELIDISTESGTMAMPGHMAEGTVGAESTMVIQVRDLIAFEEGGSTRASATLTLTSPSDDVTVATQLIDRSGETRASDTVVYDPE